MPSVLPSPPSSSSSSSSSSSHIPDVFFPGDRIAPGVLLHGAPIRSLPAHPHPADVREFEVVRRLGAGSYAVVYLVREVRPPPPPSLDGLLLGAMDGEADSLHDSDLDGREYAIKCLSKADLDDDALAAQLTEVNIHQSLPSHPNIVTLHRTLETPAFLLLLLEYVPGADLFYFLEQSRDHFDPSSPPRPPSPTLPSASPASAHTPPTPSLLGALAPGELLGATRLRLVASMFAQMCDAVAHAHAHGVFHRDIKPENFIVTDGWAEAAGEGARRVRRVVVKLTDFGLSTTDEWSADMDCGSAPYMSYECRNNVAPTYSTRAADIWSLGIVLINMLYHANPWTDTALGACPSFTLFLAHPAPFLAARFAGLPRAAAAFLAHRVFCVLDPADPADAQRRVGAAELGRWVRGLPALFADAQGAPAHAGVLTPPPPSRRPVSRPASRAASPPRARAPPGSGTPRARAPPALLLGAADGGAEDGAMALVEEEGMSLVEEEREEEEEDERAGAGNALALALGPAAPRSRSRSPFPEQEHEQDGPPSRSQSATKRRKRGMRKNKNSGAAPPASAPAHYAQSQPSPQPPAPLPIHAPAPARLSTTDSVLETLASASQTLARELSRASRGASARSSSRSGSASASASTGRSRASLGASALSLSSGAPAARYRGRVPPSPPAMYPLPIPYVPDTPRVETARAIPPQASVRERERERQRRAEEREREGAGKEVAKKPSKWRLGFGNKNSSAVQTSAPAALPAHQEPPPPAPPPHPHRAPAALPALPQLQNLPGGAAAAAADDAHSTGSAASAGSRMSATASNVTSLIMGLNAPPAAAAAAPGAPDAHGGEEQEYWRMRGRDRRPRPQLDGVVVDAPPQAHPQPQTAAAGAGSSRTVERWAAGVDGARARGASPASARSAAARAGAPALSAAAAAGSWRHSTLTAASSASGTASVFTRYSNSSRNSVSTTATSVSAGSWRAGAKPPPASAVGRAPAQQQTQYAPETLRPLPKNVKYMTGVPWELGELPRGMRGEEDFGGPPPPRKARARPPAGAGDRAALDTISERPGVSQRQDAMTSTTELDGAAALDEDGAPKKVVQKGQINALAKMLSALRR